jgi:hypothetical protein
MSPLSQRGHVHTLPKAVLAKLEISSLFKAPQRVFEIAPLVPGSPSLDVRPLSPGGTRRSERKKQEGRRMKCREAAVIS